MEIRTENFDTMLVMHLHGRLDVHEAESAEREIVGIIHLNKDKHLILVLEMLDYLGSSGLRLFISLSRLLAGNGRRLVLCFNGNKAVNAFFKIINIRDLFVIFETEDEAVRHLSSSVPAYGDKIA